ncbi:MAG TPA: MEDS domain-containing protein [Acidobacteriaceae bacterium]|jgi:signal transduction histidine kinase
MNTLVKNSLDDDSAAPPPPFLRKWSLKNTQLASCANHDHLALIYDTQEEQFDVIIPYLRLGMERGEKGVFVVDDTSPSAVIAAMERHGINVEAATASGALAIITKHDCYLKNGDFDPDWMMNFFAEAIDSAKKEGFRAVRASGEMTWALGPDGHANSRLVEYECKSNSFIPGHDVSGICQYNRRRFRPETLMHVIHTHPRLIIRGEVCENPYYIPADIIQGRDDLKEESVRRLLESMAENSRLRRRLTAETEALRRSERLAAAGQMASAMAHEINNPLEAIVNLWYLLGCEKLSPEGRGYFEMIGSELHRVSYIAKQTLEFYRAGAKADRIPLSSLVEEVTGLISSRAQAQGTAIDVQHRAVLSVRGIELELRRLFENLIVNALEAGASRVRIRVSPGRDSKRPARRGVRIAIADDGCGIAPDLAAKVFEPFFSTKKEKGTGLGLWVSKGIVQKHEGSIVMRSSTRRGHSGTVFSIFLPVD